MRIVIDLQGIQSASRYRGIGRYTYSLVSKMLLKLKDQDVWIVFNENFPDTLQNIREDFQRLIPKEKIVFYKTPTPISQSHEKNIKRANISNLIREQFISQLAPDVLFITSLFEGFHDNSTTSIKELCKDLTTCVILYDLIPLVNEKEYLQTKLQKDYYYQKIEYLKKADLLLSISEYSKKEAIDLLGLNKLKISNISTAVEEDFLAITMPQDDIVSFLNHYGLKQKFLLYVPGGFDHRKNCERLLEAYSQLSDFTRANHQLVIASKITNDKKEHLLSVAKENGLEADEFRLLGYVSDEDLKALYSLCKLFIFPSLHEGFGLPVLEAMNCGAAVIGSNVTSMPEVIGNQEALFDATSTQSITNKIEEALHSQEFLDKLKVNAHKQKKVFSWDISAQKAVEALLSLEGKTKKVESISVDKLITSIKDKNYDLSSKDYIDIAQSISSNIKVFEKPQLLVDISQLVKIDAKSGIQRVVRSILSEWLKLNIEDLDIRPIYFDGKVYRYANKFLQKNFDINTDKEDYPIICKKQDAYIALDLNAHLADQVEPLMQHFKNIGVSINFVVYDILLLQNPKWWPKGTSNVFENWVRNIVKYADALLCISQSVADELEDWIVYNIKETANIPKISSFHLGADIENSIPSKGLPNDAKDVLDKLSSKMTFLAVGTIEPRKGYAQLLEAFETLWSEDYDINLVIVGKKGWLVDELCEKITAHEKLNKNLFWLSAISDEYLEGVYNASSSLISSSEAEGFGLPLIEAAQKGLPLIVRDIPVFREVAGNHAFYFKNSQNPSAISQSIKEWLSLDGKHLILSTMKYLTWEESAKQLLKKINL